MPDRSVIAGTRWVQYIIVKLKLLLSVHAHKRQMSFHLIGTSHVAQSKLQPLVPYMQSSFEEVNMGMGMDMEMEKDMDMNMNIMNMNMNMNVNMNVNMNTMLELVYVVQAGDLLRVLSKAAVSSSADGSHHTSSFSRAM